MNIAFWSMYAGRGSTSGNMLAVSIMSSLVYSVKGIIMQLDYCSKAIDDVFESRKTTNLLMEEYAYYNKRGLDQILLKEQLEHIEVSDILDNTMPVRDTYMSYIPVSRRVKAGINNKELITGTKKIMHILNEAGKFNFIDCISGDAVISKAVLKNADVIVINICQGMDISEIIRDKDIMKKAVFLVGRYDNNSDESVSTIRKKYNISKECIGVIPYNIGFHDAIQSGKVVSYLNKYILAKRSDENFQFINDVFRATGMILRKAGYDENSIVS